MTDQKEEPDLPVPRDKTTVEPPPDGKPRLAEPVQAAARPRSKAVMVGFEQTFFAGPLPHPEDLAKYNHAFLGCAERIVKQTEEQAAHRQSLERMVVASNIRRQAVAQWLGFAAFLVVTGGAFSLFWLGRDGTAIAVIVANLLTFGSAYIFGQRKQDRELEEKRKALEAAAGEPQKRPTQPQRAGGESSSPS